MTNDASAPWEGPGLSYQRVAWSPDGQLAFASVIRSGDKAQSELFVTESPHEPARMIGQSDGHFVIYISWSPVPCSGRPTCRQLAYLIEEDAGISLRMVKLDRGAIDNRIAGFGWPFYFSWASDGQSMLWHTDGGRPDNLRARLALYDVQRDLTNPLTQRPGAFLAPAWSPVGEHWLAVSEDEARSRLQIFGAEQPITVANALEGDISFAWSPQGDQVAFAVRRYNGDPFYGPVHIFDLNSGQSARITDVGLRVLAFFWDPPGRRLGYLTWLPLPEAEWMQWRVYDLRQDKDRGFKTFHPSRQMRFIVNSFNQYAQSHRFWSPDSRYLVYADRDEMLRQENVWLIDTWSDDGTSAIFVDRGSMGFWSWD